jgi:manganese/iron transport system permease protein
MLEPFRLPFMQMALLASGLVAILCAVLGVHVVLKRVVFASAAITQIATAGMALGLLLAWQPVFMGFIATLFALLFFAWRTHRQGLATDSMLGTAYVGAFGLSILFVAKSSQGYEELQHLLQGDLLTVSGNQIYQILFVFALVLLLFVLYHKELLFVSFDPVMARTLGYNVVGWNLLFYLLIGSVISVGIQTVGVLMIFAFLVMPALVGLSLAQRLGVIYVISILTGVTAVAGGLFFSFNLDLPASPTIVVILLICTLAGLLVKRMKR